MKPTLKTIAKPFLLSLLFFAGLSTLCASYLLDKLMGHLTIEQILFHWSTPMEGVSPSITSAKHAFFFEMGIWSVLFWSFASGTLEWSLRTLFRIKTLSDKMRWNVSWISVYVLWFATVTYICNNHDVGTFARNVMHPSTMIDEQYVEPPLEAFSAPERKRNIIVVISESLEKTFSDETLFSQDLLLDLTELSRSGLVLEGQIEVNGTDNTIASMTAMLYGVPRLMIGMEGWHNFVEGNMFRHSNSILHVLDRHGYALAHIQGGSMRFAATDSLFEDFPSVTLVDYDVLSKDAEYVKLAEQGKAYGWGVNDRIMLKHARSMATELASDGSRPFFLSISTIDTHYDGYLEFGDQSEFNDFRDTVKVQGKLIADFVTWVQAQPFGEDTTVVVVGDHYVMRNDVGPVDMTVLTNGTSRLPKEGDLPQRTIYACIFNAHGEVAGVRRRCFAGFDWAPTLLDAMGFTWSSRRFGIGVSLLSDEKTLLEKVGGPMFEQESRRQSKTYGDLLRRRQD